MVERTKVWVVIGRKRDRDEDGTLLESVPPTPFYLMRVKQPPLSPSSTPITSSSTPLLHELFGIYLSRSRAPSRWLQQSVFAHDADLICWCGYLCEKPVINNAALHFGYALQWSYPYTRT
jgi:hypothetical protein